MADDPRRAQHEREATARLSRSWSPAGLASRDFDRDLAAVIIIALLSSWELHGGEGEPAAEMSWAFDEARSIGEDVRGRLTDEIMAGRSAADVLTPESLDRIVVTSISKAIVRGSEAAATWRGKRSDKDEWITEQDAKVCRICRPLHRTQRPTWSVLFPYGPPAHPWCRCWIAYIG